MPAGWKTVLFATLAGLALRLFFIFKFPATAGDTPIYDEIARNWLDYHVYGLIVNGHLTPVAHRLPGYPAFLAAVYAAFGRTARAVMIVQAVLDLVTCLLAAGLAARLVCWGTSYGNSTRASLTSTDAGARRVSTVALWLCALCPFTANYTAVVLTETLATLLITLALTLLLEAFEREDLLERPRSTTAWLAAGVVTGVATLVRPESPLLLFAIGVALIIRWRRPANWPRLVRAGVWLAVGLILPLLPWAARNWHTFHRVQFLAPRYAEMPGEFVPRGFYKWTGTWLAKFPDVYNSVWAVESDKIDIDVLPAAAFDSPEERARVAALLDRYNEGLDYTPQLDEAFAAIARERATRHPLRTYLVIPVKRADTIWFWPRIELLPFSGKIFPLAEEWDQDRADLLTSVGLFVLGVLYAALALAGVWLARRCPAIWLVVAFLLIRTAFLTQIEAPEPRYLLVAYPAILALAAIPISKLRRTA